MKSVQKDVYEHAEEVTSDPFGLVSRRNRNHEKKYDIIREHMAATPGADVLEVGCGHGLHTERYAQEFDVTAVDLSDSLVGATRVRCPDATVHQADALSLPYDDDAFAAVVGTAILHHLTRQRSALEEWKRVTRPGGSVTLMEPNYLFPLAFATTHVLPEERAKRGMAPWRLEKTLSGATGSGTAWTLTPRIYTPPWPDRAGRVFDRLDSAVARTPVVRWLSQMLLIHVSV